MSGILKPNTPRSGPEKFSHFVPASAETAESQGVNIEAETDVGTALTVAVWNGHTETVRLLLDRGATIPGCFSAPDGPRSLRFE